MPKQRHEQLNNRGLEEVVSSLVLTDRFTVAQLPAASLWQGAIVYVSNGAAGAATIAFSNGTNWVALTTGLTVSAT